MSNEIKEIRKAIRPNWNQERTAEYTVEKNKGIPSELYERNLEKLAIKKHPQYYLIDILNPQKISDFKLIETATEVGESYRDRYSHIRECPVNGFRYVYQHNIEPIKIINRVHANFIESKHQTEVYMPKEKKATELEHKLLEHYDKLYSI